MAGLRIEIDTNAAHRATQRLQNDLRTLGSTATSNERDLRSLEGQIRRSTTGLLNMRTALGGFITLAAGYGLTRFVKETALAAARYETLGVVMNVVGKNAGYSTAELKENAEALQKSGITMNTSREATVKLIQAHIDLTNSTKLSRIAQDAAVIGNINSSQALERMVYGIQTAQIEVLKTIGINVNFENSYKKLAAQLGKAAANLTENEKTQARLNVVMERGADIAGTYEASMDTASKKISSFSRYVDDFKIKMGDAFGPATSILIDEATEAMKEITDQTEKWVAANQGLIAVKIPEYMKNIKTSLLTIINIYNSLPSGITEAAGYGLIGRMIFGVGPGKLIAGLILVNNQLEKFSLNIGEYSKTNEKMAKVLQNFYDIVTGKRDWNTGELIEETNKLKTSQEEANKAVEDTEKAVTRLFLDDLPKGLQSSVKDMEKFKDAYEKTFLSATEYAIKQIEKQALAWEKAGIDAIKIEEWKAEKIKNINEKLFEELYEIGTKKGMRIDIALTDIFGDIDEYEGSLGKVVEIQEKKSSEMIDLSKRTADAMEQNFSDLFFSAMKGEFNSLNDFATGILNSMQRAIADMLGQMLKVKAFGETGGGGGWIGQIGSAVGSLFANIGAGPISRIGGGEVGGLGGGAMHPMTMVPQYHSGGIIGQSSAPMRSVPSSIFNHAPRLHNGLASDEFPAILQRGETVIPKGSAAAAPPVKVIVNNNMGQEAKVRQEEPKFNGKEWVVGIWLDAYNRNAYGLRTAMGR